MTYQRPIGIEFKNTNSFGWVFNDFYPTKAQHIGPGWYVFGRNKEHYGVDDQGQGLYVMLCARPDVPARKHPHYNVPVRCGWRTKWEAQAVADRLNGRKEG